MKRFTYFAPHKTALTCATLFAVGSLFFLLPMALMFAVVPGTYGQPSHMMLPLGMILVMPFFYFIFGYLSTAFFAWLYNLVAKYTGGISFEISDDTEEGGTPLKSSRAPAATSSGIVSTGK